MSDIICEKCGYKTFVAYALKDNEGRLICPQCREPYKKAPTNLSQVLNSNKKTSYHLQIEPASRAQVEVV